MEFQKEYIVKIATELNKYDNIIYDICDEPSLQGLPGGSIAVLPDSIVKPWISAMKDAFLHAEESLPKKHLLGQTIQNLSPDFSDESWCQWLPTEYVKPALKALNLNYIINKPLVNVETNYFGASLTNNQYNADAVRVEGWWYMLGGGAGCINLNGEFYHGNESGGVITQTLIIPQKKILLDFMNKLDLAGISRYENFTYSASGGFCNGLAVPGKQYAFYLFHGSYDSAWGANFLPKEGNYEDTLTLSKVPDGTYLAEWIDPVTGKVVISENMKSTSGNIILTTPAYSLDIALRLAAEK
jgi:hypothetical protein